MGRPKGSIVRYPTTCQQCGKEFMVTGKRTVNGTQPAKFCGHECFADHRRRGERAFPGVRFAHLTVIEEVEKRGVNRRFRCRCDCGNEKIAYKNNLYAGRTTSCGCTYTTGIEIARAVMLKEKRAHAQISDTGRLCLACNEWKPWLQFRPSAKNPHTGKSSNCTECARWNLIKRTYGISKLQWDSIFEAQGGVCALCDGLNANGYNLHVDHDHACCGNTRGCLNCVRGLLCDTCNRMLGLAEQKPKLRELFAFYLDRRPLGASSR